MIHAHILSLSQSQSHPSCPPFHVFALAETRWDVARSLPTIPHYTWYSKPHCTNSGGLACLVHEHVSVREVDASHPSLSSLASCMNIGVDADDSSAMMWLELHLPHARSSLLLGIVYLRPPVSGVVLRNLQNCIDAALRLWPDDQPLLLLGDFNLRHPLLGDARVLNSEPVAQRWVDYLQTNDLIALNPVLLPADSFTRPASESMLDLAICNQSASHWFRSMQVGIDSLVSDHECITLSCHPSRAGRCLARDDIRQPPRIDWRVDQMTTDDWKRFAAAVDDELRSCSFATLLSDASLLASPQQRVETAYAALLRCLHRAADLVIGVKQKSKHSVAWWTAEVREAYAAMKAAHRAKQMNHRHEATQQHLQQARQHWSTVKAAVKRACWKQLTASLQSSVRSKVMWSVFRRSTPRSFSPLSSFPHPVSGQLPSSLSASLNHLADAFVRSGEPPKALPISIQSETDACLAADTEHYPAALADESDQWLFTEADVAEQCTWQHTDTAAGCDSVAALMLQHGGAALHRALSFLFQFSWQHGVLPQAWRCANVVALYKGKGPKHLVTSFRPISVTSVIVRTFEHLIHHRLVHRLEQNQFCHATQFGFRQGRSTRDAILYLLAHLRRFMSTPYMKARRCFPVPVAFLDLKKAFDRVNPDRLLFLLSQRAGVNGKAWDWIRAFLSDRLIRTVHHGTCSDWFPIRYGVPQGSVLSPLLFLIFIQEAIHQMRVTVPAQVPGHELVSLPASVIDCVHILLFADDIAVLPRMELDLPIPVWTSLFQQALNCLTRWADDNQMEFSSEKSNVVGFGRRYGAMARHIFTSQWHLGGFVLQPTDSYTYLGLQLHCSMNWTAHFNRVLARAHSDAYLVSRLIQRSAPPHFPAIRALCMGYLLPRFAYGLALWRPSEKQLTQLQNCFLRPIRQLLGLPFSTNRHGMLVEANCPSLFRYRQSLLHQLVLHMNQLPPSHPLYAVWQQEKHVSGANQRKPFRLPVYQRSIGVEAFAMYTRDPSSSWSEQTSKDECKRHAMLLTHQDWLAVPHRDPTDQTCLRTIKLRPGRSIYLYREENRESATIRARLRLNRAHTQINLDRGLYTAGAGLCLHCSRQHQSPIHDTVEHMLLHCSRYTSFRDRLRAQLARLILSAPHAARPPDVRARTASVRQLMHMLPSLSLSSILDRPTSMMLGARSRSSAQQQANQWMKWLGCTGQFLRALSTERVYRMGVLGL